MLTLIRARGDSSAATNQNPPSVPVRSLDRIPYGINYQHFGAGLFADSSALQRFMSAQWPGTRIDDEESAMKVDGGIGIGLGLAETATAASESEAAGYDGLWSVETSHDPFFPLVTAAEHTDHIELGTGIAVAFARNPMNLASIAYDLHSLSQGRFILGLGSQIKPHITKRFSMEWSHPAPRMREMILAIRAIWDCWNNGTALDFRGEFYSHTLMTPFFNPGPNPFGTPKIFLAGVGQLMTEVAGETCDGFLCHAFTTEQYLREVTLPSLQKGLDRSGRTLADIEISGPAFVATGTNDQEIEAAIQGIRQQIAFYGSTPAYRGVLELHGWGDLQAELNSLSKQGEWTTMGTLIDDDMLDAFAIVASPEDLGAKLHSRYGDIVDRISFYAPYRSDPDRWQAVMSSIKAP